MNNLNDIKFKCCGCNLCSEICPKKAIKMEINEEGFYEYKIDENKCINCGLCKRKCPQLNKYENNDDFEQKVYAARIKDNEKLLDSTSGGIFQIIATNIAKKKNFSIFGAVYDSDLTVKHECIENAKDLKKIYGSKYVQSNTNGIYIRVKEKLQEGKTVLFSGTPCQVNGLLAFLQNKEYQNLYTIDLVCHGVPSPLLFKKYILSLEDKYNGKVKEYSFRSKDKKIWELRNSYCINGKKYYSNDSLDPYYYNFIKGNIYRESCYECKYANKDRVSDLTLADFWGIENEHPKFASKLGNSAILINTKKGIELFNLILDDILYEKSSFEKVCKYNHNLISPTQRPSIRNSVYKNIKEKDFDYICKNDLQFKISLTSILKSKVPYQVKNTVKKVLKKNV